MDIEQFRDFCLSLAGTTEDFPFDENILVFKVNNKIYALTDIAEFEYINVKCNPEKAEELRAEYEAVKPGFHMNKKHWNSLYIHQLPEALVYEWVKDSYDLVKKKK